MDSLKALENWSIKPLSKKEERRLLWHSKRGCQKSRETLIRSLVRFAINRAKIYSGQGYTIEDFTQFCVMGILEGIDRFNMNYKTRLITHVGWIMRKRVTKERFHGDLIHTPPRQEPKIVMRLGSDFDVPRAEPPPEPPQRRDLWFMHHLDAREKVVIDGRFYRKLTLREVGEQLDLHKERIRQIQVDIFKRIRHAEARSTNDAERGRIFASTRSCSKKPRKNHVLSRQEQVDQCFENRGNRIDSNGVPLNTTGTTTGRFGV